ncbi:MAG: hypothetical protein GXY76_09210 [Chloroflexi bacterium]|nr:hypothetical protein [Chloroflexota bacterium]
MAQMMMEETQLKELFKQAMVEVLQEILDNHPGLSQLCQRHAQEREELTPCWNESAV